MEDKPLYIIIAVLSLLCIIFSVIIYVENIQLAAKAQDFCSALTGSHGCETVQSSKYSKTFGVSNTIFGMAGFTLLEIASLLFIFERKKKQNTKYLKFIKSITILGCIIAGFVAIVFLYLQTLVIHAYCIFCLFVDAFSLILLGCAIYMLSKMWEMKRHK